MIWNAAIESAIRSIMVDLHTHSSCSDGSDSPEELIEEAHRIGVTTLALTDHDTIAGIKSAGVAAAVFGVRFIPGVELSVQHEERHVHLLGLDFASDSRRTVLYDLLQRIQERRVERNLAMIERMQKKGLAIGYADVQAEAGGTIVGRPHMASLLVRRGIARDTADAFRRLIGTGGLFHVPRRAVHLGEAIDALRAAGGHGVLAHPAGRTPAKLADLLRAVRAAGVAGVEAYHPSLSREQGEVVCSLAAELGLFVTGGSDYHGTHSPDRVLGFWRPGVEIPQTAADAFAVAAPAPEEPVEEDLPRRL